MRVGKIRRKLSEVLLDALAIDVDPEELHVIPNGGSPVYDPPRWEGYGLRSPSGARVRVYSWDRMSDIVKHGVEAGEDSQEELEVAAKAPQKDSIIPLAPPAP